MSNLQRFVAESNRIEGIYTTLPGAIEAHEEFLEASYVNIVDMEKLVMVLALAELRRDVGMDVRVGNHLPPPGGPSIEDELAQILLAVAEEGLDPWTAHVRYETLHPFMDGNGRSGRALWLWMMRRDGNRMADLGFLHAFYYQTLQNSPDR